MRGYAHFRKGLIWLVFFSNLNTHDDLVVNLRVHSRALVKAQTRQSIKVIK